MEEITASTPRPNELPIPSDLIYGMTSINTWQAVEFLLTKLEPVRLEDLDPDDGTCVICTQEYCVSEDAKVSHRPVKTVCGHVFGEQCIRLWLDPLEFWDPEEDLTKETACQNTNCPMCRRGFFPTFYREPAGLLAARFWLWDRFYDFAGVALSDIEERSRNQIWEYINYWQSIHGFRVNRYCLRNAHEVLKVHIEILELFPLTDLQESLRKKLEKLGNLAFDKLVWYDIESTDYVPFRFDPYPYLEVKEENEK